MAIHFIDIASYQSGLDVTAAASEIDGVIIKTTEGTNYVNPACDGHWQQATQAGLLRGFYHFASNGDATAEADYFMEHSAGYFGQGVPVLDWEGNQNVDWVNAFVRRVHDVKGVWCWIYANPWRFNQGGVESNCMRWVASYPEVASPSFTQAEAWDAPAVDGVVGAWQFCSDGKLSCWGGNLDFDLFYGDASTWAAYCGEGAEIPSQPSTPAVTPTPAPAAPSNSVDVNVYYELRGIDGKWRGTVKNFGEGDEGFAGLPNAQHDLMTAWVDHGTLKYQVHTINHGWLPYIDHCDKNDTENGCAGWPGDAIDGVRMYYVTPNGESYKQAWYRSQTTQRAGYLGTVCDDGTSVAGFTDDYAGIIGEPLDRLQVCISDHNPF